MFDRTKIRPGLRVEIEGRKVGTVDHIDHESFIKLKRSDSPSGRHRWFPTQLVDYIQGDKLYLRGKEAEFDSVVTTTPPSPRGADIRHEKVA